MENFQEVLVYVAQALGCSEHMDYQTDKSSMERFSVHMEGPVPGQVITMGVQLGKNSMIVLLPPEAGSRGAIEDLCTGLEYSLEQSRRRNVKIRLEEDPGGWFLGIEL